MAGEHCELRNEFSRSSDFGVEQALAAHVRNRWPTNTLAHIEREWGLTTGEARGCLYAQASRATLNKIIRHRQGGWRLGIELIARVTGVTFDDFIEQERKRLRNEREQSAIRDRRLFEVVSHRSFRSDLGDL